MSTGSGVGPLMASTRCGGVVILINRKNRMKDLVVALVAATFASVALAQGTMAAPAANAAPAAQAAPAATAAPTKAEKKAMKKKAKSKPKAVATNATPATPAQAPAK